MVVVQVSVGERRCDLSNLQNLLHAQPTVYKTLKGREEKKPKKNIRSPVTLAAFHVSVPATKCKS